jgi:cobalamin biosynthesis protein CobD/CbiB
MVKKFMTFQDPWSIAVIAITFLLFLIALFTKGLTHDLLLEAGVFLVSLKLIMMSHHQSVLSEMLEERLNEIRALLTSQREH